MESHDRFIKQLMIDTKLVVHFFGVFARLEYALKRAGFATRQNEAVSANWKKFLAMLENQFQPTRTPELQTAVDYLNQYPPFKQVLDNKNDLSWREISRAQADTQLAWLIRLIRTVRNNLFHGGKFPMQPIEEPARNSLLLSHSLVILYECLSLSAEHCPQVHANFYDELELQ